MEKRRFPKFLALAFPSMRFPTRGVLILLHPAEKHNFRKMFLQAPPTSQITSSRCDDKVEHKDENLAADVENVILGTTFITHTPLQSLTLGCTRTLTLLISHFSLIPLPAAAPPNPGPRPGLITKVTAVTARGSSQTSWQGEPTQSHARTAFVLPLWLATRNKSDSPNRLLKKVECRAEILPQ